MPQPDYDLIILGGGPAGLTAGLYAARSRLKAVLVERFLPGGQVLNTDWVENYPGFPEGVTGFGLMEKMKEQVDKFELPQLSAEVNTITKAGDLFAVELSDQTLHGRAVIITTGAEPSRLNVEGEINLTGHGVSYCGTCDAPFYREQTVIAVGGGDTACEEALYLAKFAAKVYLVHRRDQLRAQRILQERIFTNEKIEVLWDSVVESIAGQENVDGVKIKNVKTGQDKLLAVNGVFVFVGVRPNTNFVKDLIDLDKWGFITTDAEMATAIPGLFAAGDCRAKNLRQISTAVGDGATAAFAAERYLESLEHV